MAHPDVLQIEVPRHPPVFPARRPMTPAQRAEIIRRLDHVAEGLEDLAQGLGEIQALFVEFRRELDDLNHPVAELDDVSHSQVWSGVPQNILT